MSEFSSELWSREIARAYQNCSTLLYRYPHSLRRVGPLTWWQRIKHFLKFYEARYRLRGAWWVLRHGAEVE